MSEGFPGLAALSEWLTDLFYYMFYRNLFTAVTEIKTLVGFVFAQAFQETVFFPLRMTRVWYRVELWFQSAVLKRHILRDFTDQELHQRREEIATSYYFLCMSQRMSITNYAISLAIIRNSPNRHMYHFGSLSEQHYMRLLAFCLVQFLIEWVASTVVRLLIRIFTGIDVIRSGGQVLKFKKLQRLAILIAIHIMQDVYIAEHRHHLKL
eukprot:TRINITY_DN4827_c0_g2_i1.p1 TRINITY_DN4827_c0_g2~~TRINITY_DN4827_c0_g2_i1.p1  ORF type:complete len:209 (-),score=35.81 TRINITY_DN4827_c0_g2_i1:75-701(-)